MIDVAAWVGSYAFREVPHPEPTVLARVLEREGLDGAWVGWLPSAFHRDPAAGNATLFKSLDAHPTLHPTPAIRPDWPGWEQELADGVDRGAPAVRAYPPQWGLGPGDGAMNELAAACADTGLPLILTTRFEDARQRHWMDAAGDLSGAAIRAIIRADSRVRVIVTAAGRALIEEVHWGLTGQERQRLWWDFAWIWGPPEDELAHLFRTIGADRFVLGTHWPLRLVQNPFANLDLLPDDLARAPLADAAAIAAEAKNARA